MMKMEIGETGRLEGKKAKNCCYLCFSTSNFLGFVIYKIGTVLDI
jgi:hypothetical protein